MPGVAHDSSPRNAARWGRALRRAGQILLGLVGLVFLTVGGGLLVSLSWDRATGVVQDCTTRVERTGTGTTGTSTRTVQVCTVRWQAAGGPRTGSVEISGSDRLPAESVELRVSGGQAVVATPAWVGVATAAGGLAMVGTSAVLLVRRRRPREGGRARP